jgi:hypothetical protein
VRQPETFGELLRARLLLVVFRARHRLALASALTGLLSGCPSFSSLKTARALDKGEFQITVAAEVGGVSVPSSTQGYLPASVVYPQFEVASRWGVSDGLDLGFKAYSLGTEFDATIQLIRGGFDLALSPGVGVSAVVLFSPLAFGDFTAGNNFGYLYIPLHLDLLAGLQFGGQHQIVIGPSLYAMFTLASSNGESPVTLLVGGSVGVSFKLSDTFRLMPEFDFYVPIAGQIAAFSSNNGGAYGAGSGAFVYAFALGFAFGDDGFKRKGPTVPDPLTP